MVGDGGLTSDVEWTALRSKVEVAVEVGNVQRRTESGRFFLVCD